MAKAKVKLKKSTNTKLKTSIQTYEEIKKSYETYYIKSMQGTNISPVDWELYKQVVDIELRSAEMAFKMRGLNFDKQKHSKILSERIGKSFAAEQGITIYTNNQARKIEEALARVNIQAKFDDIKIGKYNNIINQVIGDIMNESQVDSKIAYLMFFGSL